MLPLDEEISRVTSALRRHDAKLDDMQVRSRGDCCPACRFGAAWTVAAVQAERTASWLCILLRKRGRSDDLALAHRIEIDAWP